MARTRRIPAYSQSPGYTAHYVMVLDGAVYTVCSVDSDCPDTAARYAVVVWADRKTAESGAPPHIVFPKKRLRDAKATLDYYAGLPSGPSRPRIAFPDPPRQHSLPIPDHGADRRASLSLVAETQAYLRESHVASAQRPIVTEPDPAKTQRT